MKRILCFYFILNFLIFSSCSSIPKQTVESSEDLFGPSNVDTKLSGAYHDYKNRFDLIFLLLRNLPSPDQDDGVNRQLVARIDEKLQESQQIVYEHLIALELAQKKLKKQDAQQTDEIIKLNSNFIEALKSESLKLSRYEKDLLEVKKLLVNSSRIVGSHMCFTDINFKPNSSEILNSKPQSKKAFERMLRVANTCPEFKFEIEDHTSKDNNNAELSQKRAQAVKDKLIKSGIKPEKIIAVKGIASDENLITEPELGSFEEKNMTAQELEYIRSINNRIEFKVVQACKE